ncbi:MAG: hypothetical protein IIB81_03105 [Nanoarchaeota archaeon]|nr:hypothetical protein [Nanoarchaeota archaeon]
MNKMNKSMIFGIALLLIIVYGCVSSGTITFNKGVKRINEIDNQYGVGMKTVPNSTGEINGLLAGLTGFAASNKDMPLSLKYLLDFRIKGLEAELLHMEGWQWGRGSTTDWGFGCRKGSARILNSSKIRNSSAQKGYESLDALKSLIEEFPQKAKSLDFSQKDVLFLNAAYQQVEDKAARDSRTIRSLCKEQIKELNITI